MKHKKLKKELGLWDVFSISTGAMFSSGFFLLPGIAAAETGPSVFLAYLFAGILVLPTMFSVSELATAMPKSGGTYYFIDRSLGPMMGTIGGIGSWFALVLKSAFALIGMGAYIGIFYDLPITFVAIVLTILFGIINVIGAKETTFLQKILVASLLAIMFFYILQGVFAIFELDFFEISKTQFQPFFIGGVNGMLATIGMVFVSYAGLTKVTSVAEEVKNPDRNIPLAMILSLIVAVFVYVVGVYIMVTLSDPVQFRSDLTPVATVGQIFMDWLPGSTGLVLVVIAAIAAFASTGNAGIMSASRYPMAMARDRLIDQAYSGVHARFGTPTVSILATVLMMIFILLLFDVESVAKLASAFQLLLFGLLNLAVIVMRESKIEEYDPGFKSPFYPWFHIAGMIISTLLILEMGLLSILFTSLIAIFSIGWYFYYAYNKVEREGAIYHVHARLGERRYHGLEHEMRTILREKGLRDEDPYEKVIGRAVVFDFNQRMRFEEVTDMVTQELSDRVNFSKEELSKRFLKNLEEGIITVSQTAALKHIRVGKDIETEIALVRCKEGFHIDKSYLEDNEAVEGNKIYCLIYLISSTKNSGQHLRILAHLAEMIDNTNFTERFLNAQDISDIREILLRDEHFINITLKQDSESNRIIGKQIKELEDFLPGKSLITMVKRNDELVFPHGDTVLQENDILSIIGEKGDIEELKSFL